MNVLQIRRGDLVDVPIGKNRLKPGELWFAEDADILLMGKEDQTMAQFVGGDKASPVVVEQADTTAGDHASELPDVVAMAGLTYVVKADGLVGGQVNITTQSGQYIDYAGNDSMSLFSPYGSIRFYSTGLIWLII